MDKKTREMAMGIIRDMAQAWAGLLRLEMRELDHVMDHLGRDLKILDSRLRGNDGKGIDDGNRG
jgi:hypothetical protein